LIESVGSDQALSGVLARHPGRQLIGNVEQATDQGQIARRVLDAYKILRRDLHAPSMLDLPRTERQTALPAHEGVAEGFPHDVCASSNSTHEAPALPHVCRPQRLHQWSDFRSDPLSDERCRIHERKHGISIAPVVRIRPDGHP
jgi:hypothetical protein